MSILVKYGWYNNDTTFMVDVRRVDEDEREMFIDVMVDAFNMKYKEVNNTFEFFPKTEGDFYTLNTLNIELYEMGSYLDSLS